jgi:uncharacterized membrane protein YgcG
MKRIALLVVLSATFLAPAQAALAGGVVVKVDRTAHLVAVNRGAAVNLVHVKSTARLHVGQRVGLKLRRLANGTFMSSGVKVLGHARTAHFHAIALSSTAGHLTVSAGGAVLSMTTSSSSPTPPGSEVDVEAELDNGGISATQVTVASATAPGGSIEGTLTLGTNTITVVSDAMALVLNLPASFDLSQFTDGQEVLATFAQQPDGTLLLVSLAGDDGAAQANNPSTQSGDGGQAGGNDQGGSSAQSGDDGDGQGGGGNSGGGGSGGEGDG